MTQPTDDQLAAVNHFRKQWGENINFAMLGDQALVCHPDHQPMMITRGGKAYPPDTTPAAIAALFPDLRPDDPQMPLIRKTIELAVKSYPRKKEGGS